MERQLERNIKDVIADFPAVEAILSEYDIGCAACAVGTCLLRDIIEVHGLSEDQERAVMERIAKAIFPGQEVSIPLLARKSGAPRAKSAGFSPPLRALVDEHVLIKRLLALVPWIRERLADNASGGIAAARTAVEFIRTYADRFHHAKEEDILFGYFDSGMEIIASMRRDHDTARRHVREMAAGIEARDANRISLHLAAYRDLLVEHIRKEDEVLYPFLDSRLAMNQVGEIFSRFAEAGKAFGKMPQELEQNIVELEKSAGGGR